MVAFEWDPHKNELNIVKHGIDFRDATEAFDGPCLERVDGRFDYGEERLIAYGEMGPHVIAVVHVWRGKRRRLRSARKATRRKPESSTRWCMAKNERRSRTDWGRLERATDKEIRDAVAADPDAAPMAPAEWFRQAALLEPQQKKAVSIRLDEDVLEWFKRRGKGYQTRINAVLRAYVETQR